MLLLKNILIPEFIKTRGNNIIINLISFHIKIQIGIFYCAH